jgi:asparagine synthase (glutamine-hydrolysing)
MCGICGKLNFDVAKPVEPSLLRQMLGVIQHRGPDGGGEYYSGPVGLGHRRLSIIDLNTGDQPMSNEDGTVWVVYNGEIYNFRELRAELRAKGHRFKSESDTEVIVHMYEEMGDACVVRFRGMFSFALWDDARKHLLLARDRVGVKPLYYVDTGRSLLFGSEIKSLLVDPEVERRLNSRIVDRFLTYYYAPGRETLLEGIHKLDPGHYLTVDSGRVSIQEYWDLHFDSHPSADGFDGAVKSLRELLRRTVTDHMISDVPVGVLLSGGIDSTGVLRYAVEGSKQLIHTFTMGFDGAQFQDERPFARLAAERYGTVHHEMTLTAGEFRDFLPSYVWHMEEPVCEPPAVALFFVAQLARENSVKVLLSGEGGDEAFGGYPEYRNLLFLERLKRRFGGSRDLLRAGFDAAGAAGYKRLRRYADLVAPALQEYYFSRTASPYTPFNRRKRELYTQKFSAAISRSEPSDVTRNLFSRVKGQPLLNQMLYVDTKSWLPDDLLVKADKMTMATSIELRVPLLDHQVLEFAARLPVDYKVKGFELKRVLKAALSDSVPAEILKRKKTGFPVPYEHWMRNELRDFIFDTILAKGAFSASYFSRSEVRAILEAYQRGERLAKEVFSLLVLELWHMKFMGSNAH